MDNAEKGFTLIELVVVITILGILAAFAFPRFAALETEARIATVQGLEGSLRSAAVLAHSLELVGTAVVMEGNTIVMANGYPNLATIDDTLVDFSGFTYNATSGWFTKTGAAVICRVEYAESTGANLPPVIGTTTSGCN